MKITKEIEDDLGIAFNESKIVDCIVFEDKKEVVGVFEQFALLDDGSIPENTRVRVIFENVSRITVHLKLGEWNDNHSLSKTLTIQTLTHEIRGFNGREMYGWEFINIPDSDKEFKKWENDASLDVIFQAKNNETNTIDIFSETFVNGAKTLQIRIWFDSFRVEKMDGKPLETDLFILRGKRAWNKVFQGTHILDEERRALRAKKWKRFKDFFSKIKIFCLIFILSSVLSSCSRKRANEKHIIPSSLIGSQIIIDFNESDGADRKYDWTRRVYEIPESGLLKTKFRGNLGWFNQDNMKFYLKEKDSLRLLPWRYPADTSDFFVKHQGEIGVMGFFCGKTTMSYVVDTVDYERYLQKDLYYRTDILGKRSKDRSKYNNTGRE